MLARGTEPKVHVVLTETRFVATKRDHSALALLAAQFHVLTTELRTTNNKFIIIGSKKRERRVKNSEKKQTKEPHREKKREETNSTYRSRRVRVT
jgi:predicted phage tail protein